jgi:hypothetical protein
MYAKRSRAAARRGSGATGSKAAGKNGKPKNRRLIFRPTLRYERLPLFG